MPIGLPSGDKMRELVRKAAIARGVSPDVAVSLLQKQGFDLSPPQIQPAGGMSSGQGMDVRRGRMGGGGYGQESSGGGLGVLGDMFTSLPGSGPLDYGGVPLATRLTGAGEVLSALGQSRPANPRVLGMVGEAKEAARMRGMAENLYNNLKDTNPMLAEAIRMNPALIDTYVKGEIDLNSQKALAETQHGYRMTEAETQRGWQTADDDKAWDRKKEEIKLEAEYDPKVLAIKEWQNRWKDYLDQSDLMNSSTTEIYRRWTGDPSLTDAEAQRMANNNITEERLNGEYDQIIDDRSKKAEVSAASKAAAMAGVKLKEDEYVTNPDEVMQGKPPVIAAAEGSDLFKEQEKNRLAGVKKESDKAFGNDVVIGAIGRLRQSRQKQDAGESWTGAGATGVLGTLPLPTEAATMQADLNTINARLGFDQLQAMREASPTGAALGPVSDFENRLLRGTIESLVLTNDPKELDQRLNRLEVIYKGVLGQVSNNDVTPTKAQDNIRLLLSDPSPEAQAEFDEYYGPGMASMLLNEYERRGRPSLSTNKGNKDQ